MVLCVPVPPLETEVPNNAPNLAPLETEVSNNAPNLALF